MKKPVKIALKILGILLAAIVVLTIIAHIPWILVLCAYFFAENPVKPEIRYGEFDYSIVYELNGETKTINDTLVCEYDGISRSLEGKSIQWKSYIKGTKDQDNYLIFENDEYRLYICLPADARYYMDDPEFELAGLEPNQQPWFILENNALTSSSEDEEKALAAFEIIEWVIEEPIENIYE